MWDTALGATIAIVAVFIGEWLVRHRDRTVRVHANVRDLAFATPIFTAYYSAHPDSPTPDSDYTGPYWTLRESVFRKLGELRYLPRWPQRNAKMIREEATEMLMYFTAIEMRANKGKLLGTKEQMAIHMKFDLHGITFGTGVPPQDQLQNLIDNGFDDLVKEMFQEPPEDN